MKMREVGVEEGCAIVNWSRLGGWEEIWRLTEENSCYRYRCGANVMSMETDKLPWTIMATCVLQPGWTH